MWYSQELTFSESETTRDKNEGECVTKCRESDAENLLVDELFWKSTLNNNEATVAEDDDDDQLSSDWEEHMHYNGKAKFLCKQHREAINKLDLVYNKYLHTMTELYQTVWL